MKSRSRLFLSVAFSFAVLALLCLAGCGALASKTINYHGISFTPPEGYEILHPGGETDMIQLSNSTRIIQVHFRENVGEAYLDPGVFEERNGFIDGGDQKQSSIEIERLLMDGHKAVKWDYREPDNSRRMGCSILIDDDLITFNLMEYSTDESKQKVGQYVDMVALMKFDQPANNNVSAEEWNKVTTVKSAEAIAKEEAAAQEAAEREAKKAREEARKNATHSAGSYKVGSDIPAGEYKLTASSGSGYYCVYPDTKKEHILENDNFSSVNYITVEEGQYIELSRCSMVEVEYAEPTTSPSGNGMYKIGFDISEGEYKLESTDHGYYCIYNDSTVDRRIQQNDNFEGSTYCYVYDGQYLVINRATIG